MDLWYEWCVIFHLETRLLRASTCVRADMCLEVWRLRVDFITAGMRALVRSLRFDCQQYMKCTKFCAWYETAVACIITYFALGLKNVITLIAAAAIENNLSFGAFIT